MPGRYSVNVQTYNSNSYYFINEMITNAQNVICHKNNNLNLYLLSLFKFIKDTIMTKIPMKFPDNSTKQFSLPSTQPLQLESFVPLSLQKFNLFVMVF